MQCRPIDKTKEVVYKTAAVQPDCEENKYLNRPMPVAQTLNYN